MTKSDVIHETGEFYGTQPDVLPETLPAGTRGFHGQVLLGPASLINGDEYHFESWRGKQGLEYHCGGGWDARDVDWKSVRKSAPSPLPEFRAKAGDWVEYQYGGERCVAEVTGESKANSGLFALTTLTGAVIARRGNEISKWEPYVGEMCAGENAVTRMTLSGAFLGLFGGDTAQLEDAASRNNPWHVTRSSLRPAPHPVESIPPVGGPLICADCGKPIENPLEACRRTMTIDTNGTQAYVPGQFHAKCPSGGASGQSKAAPTDPYAHHISAEQVDGDVNVTNIGNRNRRDGRIAALSTSDNPLDRFAAKRAAVLADIDRPLRIPKHHQVAPCVIGRTEKRVEFVGGGHPKTWPSNEGED